MVGGVLVTENLVEKVMFFAFLMVAVSQVPKFHP